MGLPAHKKRIIPHHRIMRKKHLKIKLLKFQRFRDGVCFDDLNRTLHLARPSVKIPGYFLSFWLKWQKDRKKRPLYAQVAGARMAGAQAAGQHARSIGVQSIS